MPYFIDRDGIVREATNASTHANVRPGAVWEGSAPRSPRWPLRRALRVAFIAILGMMTLATCAGIVAGIVKAIAQG